MLLFIQLPPLYGKRIHHRTITATLNTQPTDETSLQQQSTLDSTTRKIFLPLYGKETIQSRRPRTQFNKVVSQLIGSRDFFRCYVTRHDRRRHITFWNQEEREAHSSTSVITQRSLRPFVTGYTTLCLMHSAWLNFAVPASHCVLRCANKSILTSDQVCGSPILIEQSRS